MSLLMLLAILLLAASAIGFTISGLLYAWSWVLGKWCVRKNRISNKRNSEQNKTLGASKNGARKQRASSQAESNTCATKKDDSRGHAPSPRIPQNTQTNIQRISDTKRECMSETRKAYQNRDMPTDGQMAFPPLNPSRTTPPASSPGDVIAANKVQGADAISTCDFTLDDAIGRAGTYGRCATVHDAVRRLATNCGLTEQEAVVVDLVACGYTRKAVAEITNWLQADVSSYIKNAYKKLDISSKEDLKALVNGASPAQIKATKARRANARKQKGSLTGSSDPDEYYSFEIAGTRHYSGADYLWGAKPADICLVREPRNKYDKNAIAVMVKGNKAGHVPQGDAKTLAKLMDEGGVIEVFEVRPSTYETYKKKWYTDEWGERYYETEVDKEVTTGYISLVCKRRQPEPIAKVDAISIEDNQQEAATQQQLRDEVHACAERVADKYSLSPDESITAELIALGYTRREIAQSQGWTLNTAKERSKTAYAKLDVHSKQELMDLLSKYKQKNRGAAGQKKTGKDTSRQGSNIGYVGIGDFIVRAHRQSTSHKGHEMEPVEAKVNVLVAGRYLSEKKLRAFYCKQCQKYFVTETTYEKLWSFGTLCCRVVEFDEVVNPKPGKGFASDFAAESTIRQFGYNVNKEEDLSSSERQAILSLIIENDIMNPYEIINFLEGLISLRSGNRSMSAAISKWKADIAFLERYHPPKRSLKVGTMYAKRR